VSKKILMKRFFLFLCATIGVFGAIAQNIYPEFDNVSGRDAAPVMNVAPDHDFLSKVCLDLNTMAGKMTEKLNAVNPATAYPNALNTKISGLKFNNGISRSVDAEAGYYFDNGGRYGIGTGFMYMRQNGNLTLDNFHIEYKSVDGFNNTFRQVLTSDGQIKETLRTSNLDIPLLFKYKKRFSSLVGFTADAGVLFNLEERSHYSTNASFDYEAIYQYTGTQGNIVPVYDYLSSPAPGDLLITKSQYLATHSAASIDQYFSTLRNEGYNVGLGVKPNSTSGHISDMAGSVGLLLRPAISIFLRENVTLNAGVYYLYQDFKHDAPANYRITDKVGQYNPLLNSITGSAENAYGINIGVTYRFCNPHPGSVIAPVEDTSSLPENDDNSSYVAPATQSQAAISFNNGHADNSSPLSKEPDTADKPVNSAYVKEQ